MPNTDTEIMQEDAYQMGEQDHVAELTKHMHDAINHKESLDLTFASGDFVELDVHTMQYILNKDMVQQMLDSTDSPDHFQLFLNQLFLDSAAWQEE
jgi:hypothetical protein